MLPFLAEIFIDDEYLVQLSQEPHAVAEEEGQHHQAEDSVLPGLIYDGHKTLVIPVKEV